MNMDEVDRLRAIWMHAPDRSINSIPELNYLNALNYLLVGDNMRYKKALEVISRLEHDEPLSAKVAIETLKGNNDN